MKRHEIANKLLKQNYYLYYVSEYDDFCFRKETEIFDTKIVKEITISWTDGVDKVEARKFVNGEVEIVDGDQYIIQHDYDLVDIDGNVMTTNDGREFVL